MLCSNCSQPIRPIVAVDIDGTLGEYHGHFVSFAEEYVGFHLPADYAGDDEFSDHLGLEKRLYRDIKLAYRQGAQKRSQSIYFGAKKFMDGLRELDLEIWIATSRPWMRLDNVDPDTRFWLDRHKIPYDYMIYGEHKYRELAEKVDPKRVICVVDDQRSQCVIAESVGLPAIQVEHTHNRRDRFYRSAGGFRELAELISTEHEFWKKETENAERHMEQK